MTHECLSNGRMEGAAGWQSGSMNPLAERFDALAERIAGLESETERLSAQLLFTEKALTACIEREQVLRRTQDDLRSALFSRVHGLTTE